MVAAALAVQERDHVCTSHRLSGMTMSPDRMHVSLYNIWPYDGEPPAHIVSQAVKVAAELVAAPIALSFDQAMSFRTRRGYHLVLSESRPSIELAKFVQQFTLTFRKAGIGAGPLSQPNPHMTLVYGGNRAIDRRPIEPVCWTAAEFVLIESLIGQSRHGLLGRWPLRG